MPKKILIFSLAYCPFVGGAELALKEITDRIGKDFVFDMVTLRFDSLLPRFERIGNVNVHRVGFSKKKPSPRELVRFPLYMAKVLYPFFAFLKAIALHQKHRYDGFWALMAYAGFPVALLRLTGFRIPYLLTIQEGDSIPHMTKRWRVRAVFFLLRSVFQNASIVQVISSFLGDYARSMGFKGPLFVVPNGVDIEKFSAKGGSASGGKFQISDLEKTELRRKLKIQDEDNIVITTSRLVPKNAVDDVIKSLKFLPENIKFLILGTGPDEGALRELARQEGIFHRVLFLGYVPYEKIPSYLWISDIFIRPSLSEGMGSSFVEAIAAGLPVIGTPVGGIPDFLKDNETGFFCNVRDPKSIAQKIEYILNPKNKEHVARVIESGKRMARTNHDWDTNARRMKKLFQEII